MKIINWLNSIDLLKIRRRVTVSGVILFLIVALDLHRFGAWYTGNSAHMKQYGLSLLCLASFPLVVYATAMFTQFCVSRKLLIILYFTRIYLYCLPISSFFALQYMLNDSNAWYNVSIFREYDQTFLYGIGFALLSPLLVIMCLAILGYLYKCGDLIISKLQSLHNK